MPRPSAGAASKRTLGSEKRKAAAGSFRSARRQWIAISVAPASAAARPTCCSIWCSIPRWSERHESSQQLVQHRRRAVAALRRRHRRASVGDDQPDGAVVAEAVARVDRPAAHAGVGGGRRAPCGARLPLARVVLVGALGELRGARHRFGFERATATQRFSDAKKAEDEAAAVCTAARASARYSFVRDSSSRVGAWRAGGASNAQHSRRKGAARRARAAAAPPRRPCRRAPRAPRRTRAASRRRRRTSPRRGRGRGRARASSPTSAASSPRRRRRARRGGAASRRRVLRRRRARRPPRCATPGRRAARAAAFDEEALRGDVRRAERPAGRAELADRAAPQRVVAVEAEHLARRRERARQLAHRLASKRRWRRRRKRRARARSRKAQ